MLGVSESEAGVLSALLLLEDVLLLVVQDFRLVLASGVVESHVFEVDRLLSLIARSILLVVQRVDSINHSRVVRRAWLRGGPQLGLLELLQDGLRVLDARLLGELGNAARGIAGEAVGAGRFGGVAAPECVGVELEGLLLGGALALHDDGVFLLGVAEGAIELAVGLKGSAPVL